MGSNNRIVLGDPGVLVRHSGVFAFVVSFDFVSELEVFLQLSKLIWSKSSCDMC